MGLTSRELYEEDEKIAFNLIARSKVVEGRFEDLKKKGFLRFRVPNRRVFSTPTKKIEAYSTKAAEEGLGSLPSHVEVQAKLPFQLISPVHKSLVRSQYHQIWPVVQPVAYFNEKDAIEEGVEDGALVTLVNEFGEWTVKAEISGSVPRKVILSYSVLWPSLSGGRNVNFLTTDFVQKYGGNSAYNSTFVRVA
jgi:anaerobic selenocysteine-containing dehydrogenase